MTAKRAILNEKKAELERQTYILAEIYKSFHYRQTSSINKICLSIQNISEPWVSIINQNGKIICDSRRPLDRVDDVSETFDFIDAKSLGVGFEVRRDFKTNRSMMYSTRLLKFNHGMDLVLCAYTPVQPLYVIFKYAWGDLLIAALIGSLLLILLSLYFAHRISKPLVQMQKGADAMVSGIEHGRIPEEGTIEMHNLARTLNVMTDHLRQRLITIQNQQSELDAIFASMHEGVIAMDLDMKIKAVNRSATHMFLFPAGNVIGRPLPEFARNSKLIESASTVLQGNGLVEESFELDYSGNTRFFHLQGSPLRNDQGKIMGAVLVFTDVSKLNELEKIRKEFVANVSHELKTPIAAINGAAETLLDGAINQPEDAKNFLLMILRNGERLHHIIQDLLSLSKLEQDPNEIFDQLETINVNNTVNRSIQTCIQLAENKHIHIETQQSGAFNITAVGSLIEQAIVNLIENAIKYSEENKVIIVHVYSEKGEVLIDVADQGVGIARAHLPRLFERFYRVDKARSRKVGGTGLGLSIVKHICQLFNGYVTVQSEEGRGSVFTMHFPSVYQ